MNDVVSLYQFQQYLAIDDGVDEGQLQTALSAAISQIERLTARRFSPYLATLAHTPDPRFPSELLLTADLLELAAIVSNDGRSIDLSDALLVPAVPASVIQLQHGIAFTWDDRPLQSISISGTWGWHDRWALAWRDSDDAVQDVALGLSDTTITVADATAPRFQVGHLLKIGDEFLRVLSITINAGADDALTVERAVNGTAAAAHAQNTPIYIYQPPEHVKMLCLRWATWLYRVPDNRTIGHHIPAGLMREAEYLRRSSV